MEGKMDNQVDTNGKALARGIKEVFRKAQYVKSIQLDDGQEQHWFWCSEDFYDRAMRKSAISDEAQKALWMWMINRVKTKVPGADKYFICVREQSHIVLVKNND
jgi:hypothetical protein